MPEVVEPKIEAETFAKSNVAAHDFLVGRLACDEKPRLPHSAENPIRLLCQRDRPAGKAGLARWNEDVFRLQVHVLSLNREHLSGAHARFHHDGRNRAKQDVSVLHVGLLFLIRDDPHASWPFRQQSEDTLSEWIAHPDTPVAEGAQACNVPVGAGIAALGASNMLEPLHI